MYFCFTELQLYGIDDVTDAVYLRVQSKNCDKFVRPLQKIAQVLLYQTNTVL